MGKTDKEQDKCIRKGRCVKTGAQEVVCEQSLRSFDITRYCSSVEPQKKEELFLEGEGRQASFRGGFTEVVLFQVAFVKRSKIQASG